MEPSFHTSTDTELKLKVKPVVNFKGTCLNSCVGLDKLTAQ